jgi:Lon protease-like protein
MIQPQRIDHDNQAPLYAVGCVGEIVGLEELGDGRFNIVLLGSHRFRMVRESATDASYRCAEIDITAFDDHEPPPLSLVQRAEVEREARRLGDAMGLAIDWAAVTRLDDEMLVNAIAQVAPFDMGAKQALLEQPRLDERADLLVQLMQFQRAAVTGGVEIEPTLQ